MLILPKPVKDEFFPGFIRRLCHINFVDSTDEMLRILQENFSLGNSGRKVGFKAISLAAGMTEAEILWNHSHFPINLQFPLRTGLINYTLEERRPVGLTPPEWFRYRFCPACIEQQTQEHGFSFWNRAHQIPSLYWCPWHKIALRKCRVRPSKSHMPSMETTDELIPASVESDIKKYPKIQYFSDILANAYKIPYGTKPWQVEYGINNILRTLGLGDADAHEKSSYISSLASENFPKWWLEKLYEDVRTVREKHTPGICNLFSRWNWRHYEYALAIAVLLRPEEWAGYKNHDDALISIHGIEWVNQHVWASIT
ncbi:TniQ family protein [Paraburkholderia sp. A1RI_3L]|uniref:TniQ family protein n=1 Tax=Paraburkholderia TaxID=1822464 RepID=UPI003B76B6C6